MSKPYGAPIPTLTASFSGFVNGDTAASLTAQPVLGTTATQSSPVCVGGYSIIPVGAVDADYNFLYVDGALTITQAPLTVTANNLSMSYGGTVPTLTYAMTGFVNGDSASVISGTPTLSTTATSASSVGDYTITVDVSGLSATNYSFIGHTGTLTIDPATLDLTANHQSMTYGGTVPDLTFTTTGLVNGDTQGSVLSGAPATTGTSNSNAGSYGITQGNLASSTNYTISFTPGTLTINAAALSVTANNPSMTYGGAVPALTFSVSGLVNGDTQGSVLSGALTTTGTPGSNAGSYDINQGTLASNSNYTIAFTPGTLIITPAVLDVTVNHSSMTYGGAVPALSYAATGLVHDDTQAVVLSGSLTTMGSSTSGVGSYPITQGTLASNSNYTITLTPGTLSIIPAVLDVTASDRSMTYGGTVPALTFAVAGLVNSDTQGSVLSGALATAGTSGSNAGSYNITQGSLTSNANYTVRFTTGTLTINAASLVVTANHQSMTYGGTVPALTFGVNGLVNGDTQGSVLSGSLTTTGTSSSNTGDYGITQGTLVSNSNYTITLTPGTLTITPAVLDVTAHNPSMTYGETVPDLTFTSTGLVNGDTPGSVLSGSLTTTGSSHSNAGSYNITQGSLAADANYMLRFTLGTLTINPATLDVTAHNQSMIYGGTVPTLTFDVNGLVNGDTQSSVLSGGLTTTGTSHSNTDNYTIGQGSLTSDSNYTMMFTPGTLTINPAPLTITADNQSMTYGGTVPALTFGVNGLVNGDTQSSVLSGAPATTGTSNSNTGSYDITQGTLASNSNYSIAFTQGTLYIIPTALDVTATDTSMTYGGTTPALTFVVSGLANDDTQGSVLAGSLTTTGTSSSSVGSYPITQGTLSSNGNYTITFMPGTLTIVPTVLDVTANDQVTTYGGIVPALTFSVVGLVNGDTQGLVLSGSLTTTGSSHSNAGSYAIIQGSLAADANYAIRFAPGMVTIDPSPLTITANDASAVYGASLASSDGPLQRVRQRRYGRQPDDPADPEHHGNLNQPGGLLSDSGVGGQFGQLHDHVRAWHRDRRSGAALRPPWSRRAGHRCLVRWSRSRSR